MKKKILDDIMLIVGGFGIGFLASNYSWWILLLGIPYMYFVVSYYAIRK